MSSSILATTLLATFQAFFAFAPLPFLHIPEDSRIILRFLNPKNRS